MPITNNPNYTTGQKTVNESSNPKFGSPFDTIASESLSDNALISNVNEKIIRHGKINEKLKDTLNKLPEE